MQTRETTRDVRNELLSRHMFENTVYFIKRTAIDDMRHFKCEPLKVAPLQLENAIDRAFVRQRRIDNANSHFLLFIDKCRWCR